MPILYESTEMLFRKPESLREEINALMQSLGASEDAWAEAKIIEEEKRIPMTVESLKPIHFGWSNYTLPDGDTVRTLKGNTAFYPIGIYSTDANFTTLKWYRGAKTQYLFDWLTAFIYLREEKNQACYPQPVFKGNETFTFTVEHGPASAWIIAYVVLPETMLEQSIFQ